MGQTPLVEPAVDVLAVTDLRLQRRQRIRARGEIREPLARVLPLLGGAALAFLQRLHRRLQLRLQVLLFRQIGFFLFELFLDRAHRIVSGRRERPELGSKALPPLDNLGERLRGAVAARFRHARSLLGQCHLLLQLGELPQRVRDGRLLRGQIRMRARLLCCRTLARRQRLFQRLFCRGLLGVQCRLLARQCTERFSELRDLLGQPCLVFAGECELLLEPRHLGIRRVERALPVVQRVPGGEVLISQRHQPGLRLAHVSLQGLECDGEGRDFTRMALARAHRVLRLCVPQQVLCLPMPILEVAVLRGDLRLLVEPRHLNAELLPDVLDTR